MFFNLQTILAQVELERSIVEAARQRMSPEEFKAWEEKRERDRVEERRHRELCDAIKEAGRRACFWP